MLVFILLIYALKKGVLIIGYKAPGKCPICNEELKVSRLNCPQCNSSLKGEFDTCKFCQLPAEQIEFVEVFLKCRGNIKEVEKELGISYPTVRNRLDGAIQALGYGIERPEFSGDQSKLRTEVLEALDKGIIEPQEAIEQLRKMKK